MPHRIRYFGTGPAAGAPVFLVAGRGTPEETWCRFSDSLEIGRDSGESHARPGLLLVSDPTVSRSHCVLTYRTGRCFVRDTSRNGTRVDGRRLIPNLETELRPGQTLSLGEHEDFLVVFDEATSASADGGDETLGVPGSAIVTVLVGDIRNYTVLVRGAPSANVQRSVSRVFSRLSEAVVSHGGTVKEFQGDALVGFWEGTLAGEQAVSACAAALTVDALAQQLAADPSVWGVEAFPLQMDWALATGPVLIDSFGGHRPAGLSMIGEAPVLAFRLEKLASEDTARILVCPTTRAMAQAAFAFRDLGQKATKGFDRPTHVFALERAILAGAGQSGKGASR